VLLVSACLVGIPCQYDGGGCPNDQIQDLATQGGVLPFCPEVGGGLPTPRPPAEIQGGDGGEVLEGRARVVNIDGKDVTAEFLAGAQKALRVAQRWDIRLVEGDGVTAALLKREGIIVRNEDEWEKGEAR